MQKCFICGKDEKLISFSHEKFKKCLSILNFRKTKGFKYSELEFSNSDRENYGYHKKCYKRFAALKIEYGCECECEKKPPNQNVSRKNLIFI